MPAIVKPQIEFPVLQWGHQVFRAIENPGVRFIVAVGGRRIHKTDVALKFDVTRLLRRPPGSEGWYMCPYKRQAKAVGWKRAKAMFQYPYNWMLEGKPNENDLTIPLIGGRTLTMMGMNDPDIGRGEGPCVVSLDEFAYVKTSEAQRLWHEVVRPAMADKLGEAFVTSTPRGRGELLNLYRMGIPEKYGGQNDPEWRTFHFFTEDVGTVPLSELQNARRTMSEDSYAQEYEGKFLDYVGLAFHGFIDRPWPEGNIIPESEWAKIKKGCTFFDAMDWSVSSGSTAWLACAVDTEGRVIFYDEVVMPGGSPMKAAGIFRKKYSDDQPRRFTVAGRDCWTKDNAGRTTAAQFQEHGIALTPYIGRLDDAIGLINDMCNFDLDANGSPEYPRLMVVRGKCPTLISQFLTLDAEDFERSTQNRRDAADAARMAVVMNMRAPRPIAPPERWSPKARRLPSFNHPPAAYSRLGRPK